jgi:hypothetical protein
MDKAATNALGHIDEMTKKPLSSGKAVGKWADETKKAWEQAQESMQKDAARLTESLMTPAEKQAREKGKLLQMLSAGFIPQETYDKALEKMKNDAKETRDVFKEIESSITGIGAKERSSKDAFSTVQERMRISLLSKEEREALNLQREGNRHLKDIRDAVRKEHEPTRITKVHF